MKSQAQKEEDKRLEKENLHNAMVPEEEKSYSTSMECGRCKKKMVSYTQVCPFLSLVYFAFLTGLSFPFLALLCFT
jgi:hypothetical protein